MTIIIGITTPDGVLLASDSRTTRTSSDGHRIVSDNAQKVFRVGSFGVATAGIAFIEGNTIAGLMDQFLAKLGDDGVGDIDEFADALGSFFHVRFSAAAETEGVTWDTEVSGPALTFLVAGYGDDGIGHIHEVAIPGPIRGDYSPNTVATGTMWRGQTDVVTRMLKGIDLSALQLPIDELSATAVQQVFDGFATLEYVHLFPVTLRDAVDYASFLINTTINMQRFSDGTLAMPGNVPGCGGPVQILAVERSRAGWVANPDLTLG